MATGHIKLGHHGDLRDYNLVDIRQYNATPANPMAAKVNAGSKYTELEGWGEWVMDNWQAGVGRRDPAAGGFLFGDVDSRVPGQLILPPPLGARHGVGRDTTPGGAMYLPEQAANYTALTIGGSDHPDYCAVKVVISTGAGTPALTNVWILAKIPQGASVRLTLKQDATIWPYDQPGVIVASSLITADESIPSFHWYRCPLTYTPGAGTYWIQVEPTNAANEIELMCGDVWAGGKTMTYSYAWEEVKLYPFFLADCYANIKAPNGYYGFVRANSSKLYAVGKAGSNVVTAKWDTTNSNWDTLDTTAAGSSFQAGRPVMWDDKIYIPLDSTKHLEVTVSTNAVASVATGAELFASHGGYIWRTVGNLAYYSADGATWSPAGGIKVGPAGYSIRGLAGLDTDMYVSTDDGLYQIGSGDAVRGVAPWAAVSPLNGAGMINYQGALYIPVNGRVMRFDQGGTFMDIWLDQSADLPASRIGNVTMLGSLNNWLVAFVDATGAEGRSSVWAYQTEGWHHLATIPGRLDPQGIYYDRALGRLWLGVSNGVTFYIAIPDAAYNPYNDSTSRYMPEAWVETGRYFGDLVKLAKDWESVTIAGENINSSQAVEIYWQDDARHAGWQRLGTAMFDGNEVRWADFNERPSGKWVRLGLLLRTATPRETPCVQACVVKYLPMVNDRWRWTLPIVVSDHPEMPDGGIGDQLADEALHHLNAMIQSVRPVLFEDIDHVQYEVKIIGANKNVVRYDWLRPSGQPAIQYLISLSLEQVNEGYYLWTIDRTWRFQREFVVPDGGTVLVTAAGTLHISARGDSQGQFYGT